LTLHQVRIFNAIAKHLSITKAARELRVSQPSISKQLRLLEEERGIKLHTRSGQGINLTEEGRKFWDHSQRILYQIDGLPRSVTLNDVNSRVLIVGATESPSASLVPDTLKDLRQHHAQVQFILRTGDSRAVEQMLMRSEVEVGIITYPSHCAGIVVETLCSSDVTAVVPSRHPLAVKSRLSEDELSKAPFIIKSNGRIEALLRQKRLNLRIVMRCESGEAVRGAVEAGLGVGLLYRENVEHGLKDGYLKSLHIPWLKEVRFNWFIVHRSGVPLSANAKAFVALLRKRRA
jgi:DNA-binding transcriptional LysR family regulator